MLFMIKEGISLTLRISFQHNIYNFTSTERELPDQETQP